MEETQKLRQILRDFHVVTGVRVSLHDTEFREILAYPTALSPFCAAAQRDPCFLTQCQRADQNAFLMVCRTGRAYTYRCHGGLIETVAPLYHCGMLAGYVMMGQITDTDPASLDRIRRLAAQSGAAAAAELTGTIPRIEEGKRESYIHLLSILAEYMTGQQLLLPQGGDLADRVRHYIHRCVAQDLSLAQLCRVFGCSHTTLLRRFKEQTGMTVGDYIRHYRLSLAARLLATGEGAVKEVAHACGFEDQTYFSKAFLAAYGCSPRRYRQNCRAGVTAPPERPV